MKFAILELHSSCVNGRVWPSRSPDLLVKLHVTRITYRHIGNVTSSVPTSLTLAPEKAHAHRLQKAKKLVTS